MSSNVNLSLLSLFLPEGILDYFDILDFKKDGDSLTLFLQEKNIPPEEYEDRNPRPRGFMDPRLIDDFPILGMFVKLSIERRRWAVDGGDQKVSRDWELIAKRTRMTSEFATFLKEALR